MLPLEADNGDRPQIKRVARRVPPLIGTEPHGCSGHQQVPVEFGLQAFCKLTR